MKSKLYAPNRVTMRFIKVFAVACLVAVMAMSGFNVMHVEAANDSEEFEPTIAGFSIAVRNQTRSEFINAGQPIYFEGNIYARTDFFDRYNGLVFRASVGSRQGVTVRVARLETGQVSPPRRIGESETLYQATAPPALAENNDTNLPPGNENQAILHNQEAPTNVPRAFTDEELQLMIENAPNHRYVRSGIIIPNRKLTDAELDRWIEEYIEMGGFYASELELVRLINVERESAGLQPLVICPDLMMAARFRAQGFGNIDYFSHSSPVYGGSLNFSRLFGFTGGVAEVIGRGGFGEAQEQFNRWSNSPSHRAIMMHPEAKYIGIGSAWVTTPRETTARVGMIGFCWADSD